MSEWRPDWSIHPGEILREALHVRGLTQAALARMLHRPAQVINEIIGGKKAITAATALDLEAAVGISAEFWVHAQASHNLTVARQGRRRPSAASTKESPEAAS